MRFKFFVLFYIVGSVVLHLLTSSQPLIYGAAIDAVIGPQPNINSFYSFTLILLGMVVARGLVGLCSNYSLERIANGFERDIRDELYLSLLRKGQSFFNNYRTGDLMARTTDDTRQLNEMFAPGLGIFFDTIFSFVLPLLFIALIHPMLLLPPLLFLVLFAIVIQRYNSQLGVVSEALRRENGEMTAELNEAVAGFELIEVTGQKATVIRRFTDYARKVRDLAIREGQIQALYVPPLLLTCIIVLAFGLGLYLVNTGQIQIGSLIAYFGLLETLRSSTWLISISLILLRAGTASAERILTVLNDDSSLDSNHQEHSGAITGEIVFEHVTFSYDGAPVLNDVSFRVPAGQTLALVGPTGSGKTTIVKLVNRLYNIDSGSIRIDGVDIRSWDLDALRSQIGVIEQDVVLFSRSIADNIAYGAGKNVPFEQIEQAARDAQAHGFISGFRDGYDTQIGGRGVTLSGGQRQRLAIARALITNPRLLILDDSTSAVDSATEAEIQRAISRVAQNRTTLLITHRLSQIRRADLILVLDRGAVVDQGPHDELIARCELYRRMFAPYSGQPGPSTTARPAQPMAF
ncbi:MAG: ABC transporter ATP-binding protein [Roseiflexaceae bacterium]